MTHTPQIPELLAAHKAITDTPQVWLDVSRGLVTPVQAAAAMSDRESAAMIERSKALFAPPSAAQERAIRARVLEHAAPRARAWGWGWIAGRGGLAVAAAVVLALSVRAPADRASAEAPPLGVDGFQVETSAGLEAVRGGTPAAGSIPMFRRDQRVDFTLRPNASIPETELEVVLLARGEHGRIRLGPPWRETTTGLVRRSERLDALGLTPGRWELVFVVGRPGQVPAMLALLGAPTAGPGLPYDGASIIIDVTDGNEP